jgi:hypothetical protein
MWVVHEQEDELVSTARKDAVQVNWSPKIKIAYVFLTLNVLDGSK